MKVNKFKNNKKGGFQSFEKKIPGSEKNGPGVSTTRLIAGSFLVAILAGALILMLPISSADGTFTHPVDALFTATTSICVTGLVTKVTALHWSIFGKIVIMLLAQLGGLGVITVITMLFVLLGRRITLKERLLISEAYNLGELKGMVALVKRIVIGTLTVELMGFLLSSVVFVPEYGIRKGLFCALFHAVSAFCNAGMDILGEDSLMPYALNPLLNATTMILIVLGGLGFPVWWDLIDCMRQKRKHLKTHTKLVLWMSGILIVIPAVLFMIFEYHNPDTIGNFTFGGKVMVSFFQSVTTRTAGFASIDQGKLTNASSLLTIILMFIGGSPAGTAGGMKTTTIAILLGTVLSMAKGQSTTSIFHRRIAAEIIRSALCVVVLGLTTALTACLCLMAVEDASFLDITYEVISALGTAGLSRGITSDLSVFSKLVLIITMYIGRIGPITMVIAIMRKGRKNNKKYELPEGKVIVG